MGFMAESQSRLVLSAASGKVEAAYFGPPSHAVFLVLSDMGPNGSSIVPYAQGFEGSTVFLPILADRIYFFANGQRFRRDWDGYRWSERTTECPELDVEITEKSLRLRVNTNGDKRLGIVLYVKDVAYNNGWGRLLESCDPNTPSGIGDKAIGRFYETLQPGSRESGLSLQYRFHSESRERIYELFVRLFGNTNERRKPNGTLAENGCGKFGDITDTAIDNIARMGFTHIWLMGVVRHATTTSYESLGLPADDTDLMKGLAGSPYAQTDLFDVSPDLAMDPAHRLQEFRELVDRIHRHGLKVLIDLVGNHVSRAYNSQTRPDMNFGIGDDTSRFFRPDNSFFYLSSSDEGSGAPLRLPSFDRNANVPLSSTCRVKGDCDGLFAGEMTVGKVTGNNRITWMPSINDWYETVKLNYGYDFSRRTQPSREFPHAGAPDKAIPDTWRRIDAAVEHWQELGIDGFRCDMAHMIPPEFWRWCIGRSRSRNPGVFFMAEAYNDPLVVRTTDPVVLALGGNQLYHGLLAAGFNAVYGHDTYQTIKGIYDGPKWANDIDRTIGNDFLASRNVFYAENHDEVRLASEGAWGGIGPEVGRVVSAVLFGLSRGPILFYNGQEVGEPASDAEGFSGSDGRTTIFDYWSMPEFCKWVNGHAYDGGKLSGQQRALRQYYARLLHLCGESAFRDGQFFGLNGENAKNPEYGRVDGETHSGHWLYSFLRYNPVTQQRFLVLANFHPRYTLTNVRVLLPDEALELLQLDQKILIQLTDRLSAEPKVMEVSDIAHGILIPSVAPLTAHYFHF
jgi:glycosidase